MNLGDGSRHARRYLRDVRRGADVRRHAVDEVPERADPNAAADGSRGDRGDVDGVVQLDYPDGADGADVPDGPEFQGRCQPGGQSCSDPGDIGPPAASFAACAAASSATSAAHACTASGVADAAAGGRGANTFPASRPGKAECMP